jgi:anhydro-N-acetylmuramic acid kinase
MGDPGLIAARTGMVTVADFRRKDVALGGQGAPLVPGFHAAMFGKPGLRRAILNIGGIANLTLLEGRRCVGGFDTGPGNCLMDAWCLRQRGQAYDRGGAWAASGRSDADLLESLLDHPFLSRKPPKSTGREAFNMAWLDGLLHTQPHQVGAKDVQASLLEFTARSVQQALAQHFPEPELLAVCGGGAHNKALVDLLAGSLGDSRVCTTEELGLAPDWVEAVAFAWLARQCLAREPGNLPQVTGASRAAVLGGIFLP